MTDLQKAEFEIAAQEMALHVSMCVNAEYIHSWGLESFLSRLEMYVQDEAEYADLDAVIRMLRDAE